MDLIQGALGVLRTQRISTGQSCALTTHCVSSGSDSNHSMFRAQKCCFLQLSATFKQHLVEISEVLSFENCIIGRAEISHFQRTLNSARDELPKVGRFDVE